VPRATDPKKTAEAATPTGGDDLAERFVAADRAAPGDGAEIKPR
jgi:hypothetical protein